ncbi:MAG: rod shape-determining protein, partial [Deltaproteobacteria bacterium]|nr:rod shape-determining protein [Deltaproteobacteria bacterium]
EINSEEVREAIQEPVNAIVESVKVALERTPPELSADIVDRGIFLAGGGALLRNLDVLIREETGLPVMVAEDPMTCVVRGTGMALDQLDTLRGITIS